MKEGTCNLVIGTSTLLERRVTFKRLGFVVIDEQQKFGVAQRDRSNFVSTDTDARPHMVRHPLLGAQLAQGSV